MSATRLQYCLDGDDISGQMHSAEDADEVRVWSSDDDVLVAVAINQLNRWEYIASDTGPHPDWPIDEEFDSWRAALAAFGF